MTTTGRTWQYRVLVKKAPNVSQHRKFSREKLDGRIVRISDGDNLIADASGVGRLNVRLAHIDAPELDQPGRASRSRNLLDCWTAGPHNSGCCIASMIVRLRSCGSETR